MVGEALEEAHEPMDIGEVGGEAERDPDRRHHTAVARGEAVAQLVELDRPVVVEPATQIIGAEAVSCLAGAGVAEAPVRNEIPARFASCSTSRSSTTRPSGSRRRNAIVPPRSTTSVGPRIATIG